MVMGPPLLNVSTNPFLDDVHLETNANNLPNVAETSDSDEKQAPVVKQTEANVEDDLLTICSMAMDRGPCYAAKPRYFYDKEVGECRPFRFGGCDGNRNNFLTMDECVLTCGWVKDAVKTSLVQGQ